MVRKEIEVIGWIFYFITIALIIFVVWMLILKLTGHSPTDTSVILWALGIIGTLMTVMLTVLFQVNSKIGELSEFKRQTIEKINNIEKRLQ